jgi:hypothetical protein
MKRFLFYILVFFSITAFAQFEERFVDGGFNVNPHWDTLSSNFVVVDQVLNFQATNSRGKAAIVTAENAALSVQWEIYLRLGFQPSDSDNVKIVLSSDQLDIRNNFNGYFVKIGQNGTTDGLDFYRKDGNNEILLKQLLSGQFATGAEGNLKVTKNNLGKWVFFWKNFNQPNYIVLDSVRESTHEISPYFGMICNYTPASKDSFWFDDIYSIQLPLVSTDTIPPTIESVELVNRRQIDVYFDEIIDIASAQASLNYTLSTFGNPTSVSVDATNKKLVHLYFTPGLSSNTSYTLTTNFVKDTVGNIMATQQNNINTPYFAIVGDVIVNEIMVKPPVSGLPNKQFVELRNTTNETIRLKNWMLNNRTLNDGYLFPNGYVILCAAADTNSFKPYGNTVGINNWQPLTFDGAAAVRTDVNELMDSLPYTDETYQDPIKQQGGWSMELDTQRYVGNCPKSLFWSASVNLSGGTPGIKNSKGFASGFVNATDSLVNNSTIELNFQVPMDRAQAENLANYSIDNGIVIQSVVAQNPLATKVKVNLLTALSRNIIYTLIVKEFAGCIGYTHAADTFKIAITDIPVAGEIVINEVLFHPNVGGEQFVELYNTTNKLFKIKDLIIAQADAVSEIENQVVNLKDEKGFLFPNDYVVFSKSSNTIKSQYNTTILSKCIDITLPLYDTREDIVILKNSANELVDKLHYYDEWHFPLLTTKQGVSLERTSFSAPTQNKRNWHSAAKDAGLATPGYLNSEDSYSFEGNVQIIPEIFSPDGDGIDDVATITYSFDEPGSVVNVYLYNADGRLANYLAREITIPKDGYFIWNGDDEDGNKKDVGIYFLVFERKLPDGEKIIYKRRCVLAAKLN